LDPRRATPTAMTTIVRRRGLTPKRLRRRRRPRRPAVQERNVERWLRDRDRRELEARCCGRQRAEILGWRGKPLIRIGARSHDLNVRRHWLTHRDRPVPKLVGQLVSAERGRCDERREDRSGRSHPEL